MATVWRRGLTLLAIFALVPLLNFPLALVSDRTLFVRDISMVWAPQVEAIVAQVGQGEFPFFDARRAFGQPLFADPRAEVLYPPAWIHWILPPEKSYSLFCALHLLIAAFGAARLVRRLIPDASVGAQATAGIAFAAGGPMLSLVSHWHHLAAAAWMPWILERADPGAAAKTPWVSLSLLVTLQILAGSPDYTFLTLVLCLIRLLIRTDVPRAARGRVVAGLSLGILISAVQLLPSLAFAHDAARDPLPVGWARSPLHPALTIETVVPVRVESWPLTAPARKALLSEGQVWMFSHYLGFSVWALALLGLPRMAGRTRQFALASIIIGIGFAWGVRNEGLQHLVAQVPLVSGLRFPTKHLVATSLGLALAAAHAVATPKDWSPRARKQVMAGAGFSLALLAGLFGAAADWSARWDPRLMGRPFLACVCVAMVFVAGRRVAGAYLILPAIVGIDLLGVHTAINPTTPATLFRDRPPLTALIPRDSRLYVSDYSIVLPGTPVRNPAGRPYELSRVPEGFTRSESLVLAATWYLNPPSAGRFGYFGSFDLDVLDFYRAPLKKVIEDFVRSRDPRFVEAQLQRASVDYVVTMDPPDLWRSFPVIDERSTFFEAPVRLHRVPDPWPRVRIENARGELAEGSIQILEMTDGRIRVEATSPEPGVLVVASANDRGWRAWVDGEERPIVESPMAFLGVSIEGGGHTVEFGYRPPWIEVGGALTGLGGLALFLLVARRRP